MLAKGTLMGPEGEPGVGPRVGPGAGPGADTKANEGAVPKMSSQSPIVGIVMGSSSDMAIMSGAREILDQFSVPNEVRVVSAHRTPKDMLEYGQQASLRGLKIIIAGAGGAAHLPGMIAATTPLPVIGVPVALDNLDGLDSLLSIVQMPKGVPVATMAINGARNAGLLAVRILALFDKGLHEANEKYRSGLMDQARAQNNELNKTT